MDGSSIFQIARKDDVQIVDFSLALPNGKEIDQRLCGVLVGPIARIDDRLLDRIGSLACGLLLRMADHRHIGIAANHLHRIDQGLSLLRRCDPTIGKADHSASQAMHGRLKREPCPSRRLEEAAR
jgi:hypothetical protein